MRRSRKPSGRNVFTVEMGDSEDRVVAITARYSARTSDYFCKSFGNYLPGDPEDVEVLHAEAVDEGANVAEVEADEDRIFEAVRDAASEGPDEDDCRDDDYDREERRRERMADPW